MTDTLNDDTNDDENDTDILPRYFAGQANIEPRIEHMKYHKENNLYTMSRLELQITVSHQLSAAIRLRFISAAVGCFAKGTATRNDDNNF